MALPLAAGPLAFTMVRARGGDANPVGVVRHDFSALTSPVPLWAAIGPAPAVMGVLNVTPDSFSDGGRTIEHTQAIDAGRRMLAEDAAILDIGGESTRPGASPVSPEEECRRVVPVIAALSREGALISIDTRNAATMAAALDAGAAIVNDVSALQHDPNSLPLVAARRCPVILMHMRGTPKTMNGLAHYDDVGFEVLDELAAQIDICVTAGIERANIAIDPGFGFAKTGAQSRELLQRLPLFVNLFRPIIAGMSRKRFLGEIACVQAAEERDPASVAACVLALSAGATIIRAHNVAATVQAVRVWEAMQALPEAKGS